MIQEVGGEIDQEDETGREADATQQPRRVVRTHPMAITTAPMPHRKHSM